LNWRLIMKIIEISIGSKRGNKSVAWVDDENYESLNEYRWSKGGKGYAVRYVRVGKKQKTIYMHKEVMSLEGFMTDHIDGDRLNNQKHNLRLATAKQNLQNQRKTTSKKLSIYKGVSRRASTGKWIAYIVVSGNYCHLGCYNSEEKAGEAYNNKAKELWGDRACLNVLDKVKG